MRANSQARSILNEYPDDVKQFFANLDEKCESRRISLVLSPFKTITISSGRCSGYFDPFNKKLAVCLGNDLEKSLSVAIHESCHLDQEADYNSVWYEHYDNYSDFFSWIEGSRRKKPFELVQSAIAIEADCERRALKQVRKNWSHIINPKEYAKRAAVYIYFYLYCYQTRNWSNKPFVEEIIEACPAKIPRKVEVIPQKLLKQFERFL